MSHPSLRVAAASYALELAESALVVRVANEALDDGMYSHGLGELILLRYPIWSDCAPLFASALRELQIPIPEPVEAVMSLVEYHAVRLTEGTVSLGQGLGEFYALYQALGFRGEFGKLSSEQLAPIMPFVDRYYILDEYAALTASLGPREGEHELLDRFRAETMQMADEWCGKHWAPRLRKSWLTPNVLGVARGILADRDFHRLPILADALRDEGCDDEDILDHLMYGRGHVRTCFVLGLIGSL